MKLLSKKFARNLSIALLSSVLVLNSAAVIFAADEDELEEKGVVSDESDYSEADSDKPKADNSNGANKADNSNGGTDSAINANGSGSSADVEDDPTGLGARAKNAKSPEYDRVLMKVNTDSLNVRYRPSLKSIATYKLKRGDAVEVYPSETVYNEGVYWVLTKNGYVAQKYLTAYSASDLSSPTAVRTVYKVNSPDGLNVREKPSVNSRAAKKGLKYGETVVVYPGSEVYANGITWIRIKFTEKYDGYVAKKFLI